MNINEIGQKKKKQAVRRLSQSSPAAQINRKEDIRRKLEAKRLAGGSQTFRRGRGRRNVYKSSQREGYGRTSYSPYKFERGSPRKYVSPLVNTTTTTTTTTVPEHSGQARQNMPQNNSKNENVFERKVFKNERKRETVFVGSPFQNVVREPPPTLSETTTVTQQGMPIVFGAFVPPQPPSTAAQSSANSNLKTDNITEKLPANIFGGKQSYDNIASISQATSVFTKNDGHLNRRQSPLAGLTSFNNSKSVFQVDSAQNAGNVAKTVTMFEQKAAQYSPGTKDSSFRTTISQQPFTSQIPTVSSTGIFGEASQHKSVFTSSIVEQLTGSPEFTSVKASQNIFGTTGSPESIYSASPVFSKDNTLPQQSLFSHPTSPLKSTLPKSTESPAGSKPIFQKSVFGGAGLKVASTGSRLITQSNVQTNVLGGVLSPQTSTSPSMFKPHSSPVQTGIFGVTTNSAELQRAHNSSAVTPPFIGNVENKAKTFGVTAEPFPTTGVFGAASNAQFGQNLSNMAPIFQSSVTAGGAEAIQTSGFVSSFKYAGQPSLSATKTVGSVVSGTVLPSGNSGSTGTISSGGKVLVSSAKSIPRRERRVSSSNVDVSELTAIVIKGLTREYLNKKILTDLLSRYGEINKISVQPTKEQAVVTFEYHESAKQAKSNAKEVFPVENIGVYWYKRNRTTSGGTSTRISGHLEGLSETNRKELQLRKISISNALKNIDISAFPPALTAKERFNILDDMDIKIRQAIKPYTDLATAPTIIGVCPDMCPEKERYMREDRINLSIFEIIPGTQENRDGEVPQVDHARAVKEYSRSAADKLEPLAHEMRPVHVLQITMDYLASNIMDNGEGRLGEWFNFLWDRTRAIRKDITQQHLCDVEVADLVEKITRFHIFCAHYLCEEDMHSFDPKINNENLTKCLQTLKQIYEDLHRDKGIVCSKEAEFQAYDILLNLNEGDTLRKATKYRGEVRNSSEVKFALQVFSSLSSNNYVRFFYLLKSASYLNACIMQRYFTQVRSSALQTMTKAYRPQEQYPLESIMNILLFEDKEHAKEFCEHYGFATSADFVQFSKFSFIEPENVYPLRRARNTIEIKRKCPIGEVVSGSQLKPFILHEPHNSFDLDGRYAGLEKLWHLLRGDEGISRDTGGPETPDYYSEHDASLSFIDHQSTAQIEHQSPGEFNRTEQTVGVDTVDNRQDLLLQVVQAVSFSLLQEVVNSSVRSICQNAIAEAKLKREMCMQYASNIMSECVSSSLRHIAKECLQQEVKEKRERMAVRESINRISGIVLGEILNTAIRSELVAVVKVAIKEIERKVKAQCFLKMSSLVASELTEEVVSEQCREIAHHARKEAVKEKKKKLWKLAENVFKSRRERYFKRWMKEYRTTLHIKDILIHMPPLPAILTPEEQVQKLFNKSYGNDSDDGTGSLRPSYISVVKKRPELENQLSEMAKQRESKRARAKEPIDIAQAVEDLQNREGKPLLLGTQDGRKTLKLVLSLHGDTTKQDTAARFFEENIKSKFTKDISVEHTTIPNAVKHKIETLSCYTLDTRRVFRNVSQLQIDVKACSGILRDDQLRSAQENYIFLGLTGVIFVLTHSDNDKMFWTSSRTRLRQILKSKPRFPSIPLVILNIGSSGVHNESIIEKELDLGCLMKEGYISQWLIFEKPATFDTDELHVQLLEVFQWLVNHCPPQPKIMCRSLKSFVENEVYKLFTVPLCEEMILRKDAVLQPQCPEAIIALYNTVIDHILAVVTNRSLQDLSWPVPEFLHLSNEVTTPAMSWNAPETFQYLRDTLTRLKLPAAPSPAQDGQWHSECLLCLDYVTQLISRQHFKNFGFSLVNRVEKILNPSKTMKNTSLTAADVAWPRVVQTCVSMLLSWLQSLSDVSSENVFYFEKDVQSFTEPTLWRAAVMETLKLVKEADREKKKNISQKSFNTFGDFELEFTKTSSSFGVPCSSCETPKYFTEDIENKARFLDEQLFMEKRCSERFEQQLKSLLDEDFDHTETVIEQGTKRKCNPSWISTPEKALVKSSSFSLDDVPGMPALNSTLKYFETSLVSFQDQMKLQRHIEEFSENQLKEALELSP